MMVLNTLRLEGAKMTHALLTQSPEMMAAREAAEKVGRDLEV